MDATSASLGSAKPTGCRSELPDVAIEFGFSCVDFQDTDWTISTVIKNTVRRRECNWELMIFYVAPATEDFAIRLDSEDPDELKTAFNRLLRDMMGTMELWDSQSKN